MFGDTIRRSNIEIGSLGEKNGKSARSRGKHVLVIIGNFIKHIA